jgi:hypothetical protein
MCRDLQLLEDLENNVDIHFETGVAVYPEWRFEVPDHLTRRRIKSVNFGLIYGGSDKSVSEQTGVSRTDVAKTREALYTRYPGIKAWQDANIVKLKHSVAILPGKYTPLGNQKGFSIMEMPTGRRLYFETSDSPEWLRRKTGEVTGLAPTQIKDYPMQSLATGDWVPCAVADYLSFYDTDVVIPINTTHDDVEFDSAAHLEGALGTLFNRYLEEQFPSLWSEWTGTDLLVQLKVKAKAVNKDEPKDEEEVIEDDNDSDNSGESDGDSSEPIE